MHGGTGDCMLSERKHYYGWGMDALVAVCSWNTKVLWLAHRRTGNRMLSRHVRSRERYYGLAMGHGCTGHRMISEHECHYGLGMDALVIVCFRKTNVIMVWAWMRW